MPNSSNNEFLHENLNALRWDYSATSIGDIPVPDGLDRGRRNYAAESSIHATSREPHLSAYLNYMGCLWREATEEQLPITSYEIEGVVKKMEGKTQSEIRRLRTMEYNYRMLTRQVGTSRYAILREMENEEIGRGGLKLKHVDAEPVYCSRCHEPIDLYSTNGYRTIIQGDATSFNILCEHCRPQKQFYTCRCCQEFVYEEALADGMGIGKTVCLNCATKYVSCSHCGEKVDPNTDGVFYDAQNHPHCRRCWSNHENDNRAIHRFDYRPDAIFFPDTNRNTTLFYGVELEVDNGGENPDEARYVCNMLPNVYAKHDGSLSNGFEIVSHPTTMPFFMSQKNQWYRVMQRLVSRGYLSHNVDTCGLHVHVSRKPIGEENVPKLMFLVNKFWKELCAFSRRDMARVERWARRYECGDINSVEDMRSYYHRVNLSGMERYHALNLCNQNTVEFRLFKGSLKPNTFFATIQLCECFVNAAMLLRDSEIELISWDELVTTDYEELNGYLESRNLIGITENKETAVV